MERERIEKAIRSAFAGVRLGSGVSLWQADWIDESHELLFSPDFDALPEREVTDDWTSIPEGELRRAKTSFLDSEGLRYYLPALMLWVLDSYDREEERHFDLEADQAVTGTIWALAPGGEWRDGLPRKFDSFSLEQKAAIAAYLEALPRLVDLDHEDAKLVARSLDRYWRQFLPG